MAWVRIDDGFDEHPKIAALSAETVQTYVFGLCYANRNLTNGLIPRLIGKRYARKAIVELERAGLWLPVDGGWQIHDFLEYQPSKEDVERERQRNSERQLRYRHGGSNGVTNGVSNGVGDAVINGGPVPKPVPKPLLDKKRRVTTVGDEFREKMLDAWEIAYGSRSAVTDAIDHAMSHKARLACTDQQAYLRTWLRRGAPKSRLAIVEDDGPQWAGHVRTGSKAKSWTKDTV